MTRVPNNLRKRHQKKLKLTKGFRGTPSILYKIANQQLLKTNKFQTRRLRKRYFRRVWIGRINAKVRQFGLNYNDFMNSSSSIMNTKILSQLAIYDPQVFKNSLL